MKILKGIEHTGILDESTNEIMIRNKKFNIPPNIILSTGDSLLINGSTYDVIDYNPSWFSEVAKRGAQIIQSKDAAHIISRTGVSGGSRVLEAGIGSGALSSALLWTVGKDGSVISVETEREAIGRAKANVSGFQNTDNWEIINGDVKSVSLPGNLDCVILDMPDPWNAIDNVLSFIRVGGYLVTYSPTFNQTEKNVEKMVSSQMAVIETSEIIKRNILVRPDATRPDHQMIAHTAFITIAVKRSGHSVRI